MLKDGAPSGEQTGDGPAGQRLATRTFHISRTQLAWIASEEYVRSFWWIIGVPPVFGIAAMAFGTGPLQAIGMFGVLFPFSIPARAVVSTSKASKLFSRGCKAFVDEEFLTFIEVSDRERPLRWRLSLTSVRDVVERKEVLLVRLRMLGATPIPYEAFESLESRKQFMSVITDAVAKRLEGEAVN